MRIASRLTAIALVLAASICLAQSSPPASKPYALAEQPVSDAEKAGVAAAPMHDASDAGDLAKKLSNPISSLISVPLQNNFDFNLGPDNDKWRYTLNVQPVIPVSIAEKWNLITRVIVPFINQESLAPGISSNLGLGDTTPTFFFSPKDPVHGWIIGAGPVFLLPTATDTALGSGKWGAGPSVVFLQQKHGWTYGALLNHIWSFAGDDDRPYVNSTFIQPFLAYNTKHGTGITLQTETTYDWNAEQWTVPIGLFGSQVLKLGKLPVSIQLGPRFYAEGPSGGPEWGMRFNFTLLFPK